VAFVQCYQRAAPRDLSALWAAAAAREIDAITLTSSEALRHLVSQSGAQHLWQVPLFVPHQRIHDAAARAGFTTVVLTPPGDAGLLSGMEQYFDKTPD
jgi:uroporphyrinogen-III synthase